MNDVVWEAIKEFTVPALGGVAALVAAMRAWWRRRRRKKRRETAEAEGIRKLLDAARYQMFLLTQPDGLVDQNDHEQRIWQLKHEIDDVREELWLANGHKSKRRRDG